MNSVVEKLAAIEREVAAIQPKMAPLTERIADLDQKVAGFAQQLSGIAEESAAVKQDIELTRKCLARIQTLIGESKVESEQLLAGQEENLQRCETMTAVFGAAFQAVSQFFEAAQRM
jgi:chromosome segregation ATPase